MALDPSSHLVLARKWRPERFAELVGQEHVTRTLGQALQSGRIAHAFLFTGIRGVGKTTAARILARCLNCEKGPTPEPCGECAACIEIRGGRALDVVEIDGATWETVLQRNRLHDGKFVYVVVGPVAPATARYR